MCGLTSPFPLKTEPFSLVNTSGVSHVTIAQYYRVTAAVTAHPSSHFTYVGMRKARSYFHCAELWISDSWPQMCLPECL